MSEKGGNKRTENDKFVRAFREGAKRAYGKVFWRWLDERRGTQSPNHYCREWLGIEASTYSRGLSSGRLCLENMLHLLLQVGASLREDAPELPHKRVLQTMGFQQALATRREVPLVEVCYAQVLVMGNHRHPEVANWFRFQEKLAGARSEAERRAWRVQIKFLEEQIAQRAQRLIEAYYQTYPEERPPTRTHYLRDCKLVWELCGADVKACELSLYAFRWIGLDG